MTAKEYLRQYIDANQAINAKLEEIAQLKAKAEKITSVLSPSAGNAKAQDPDRLSSIIAKIVDMEREVDNDIKRLTKIKQDVEKAIMSVWDSQLRTLLHLRYICGYTFEKIAVEMERSYVHVVHRLHPKALQEVKIFCKCNRM